MYRNEAPSSSRTDSKEFSEGLPSRNPVRAGLVWVSDLPVCLSANLRRNSGILESDIDQVNALFWWENIVGKSCQNRTVQPTGEQNSDTSVMTCYCHRRVRNIQKAKTKRFVQSISKLLNR